MRARSFVFQTIEARKTPLAGGTPRCAPIAFGTAEVCVAVRKIMKLNPVLSIVLMAVALGSCGGGGGGATTNPTSATPQPRASLTGNLTTRGQRTAAGGYDYTSDVQLSESGGAGATISAIGFTFFAGDTAIGTVDFGAEAWVGGNTILANGTLRSKSLTASDNTPDAYATRTEARISYRDVGQNSGSLTLSTSIPSLPPAAKFSLTGTVKAGTAALREVRLEVRNGLNTGRSTRTDSTGKYALADLTSGTFTVRASKTGYTAVDKEIALTSTKTLNFSLTKASNGDDDDDGGGAVYTCNGNTVPSVVNCPNNQGRKPPTAKCKDGTYSCSQNNSGTCSHHGGVACWVCPGPLCPNPITRFSEFTDSRENRSEWLLPTPAGRSFRASVR
jgi:hypothetical protein